MTIQDTSLAAYEEIKKSLHGRQLEVLYMLESSPNGLAAFEISQRIKAPKPWIMPRITELQEKGLVEKTLLRRIDPYTGKRGIVWRQCYPDPSRQMEIDFNGAAQKCASGFYGTYQ